MVAESTVQSTETNLPPSKECNICHQVKPASEFYVERRRLPSGRVHTTLRAKCKQCEQAARRAAYKPRKVSADDKTGGSRARSDNGQYHFDTRFVKRLQRMARILDREGWRSPALLSLVDNRQLAAAGMMVGDIQILRKAQSHNDKSMLYYIMDEPLAAQIVPVTLVQEAEPAAPTPAPVPEYVWNADEPEGAWPADHTEPDTLPTPAPKPAQAPPWTLSDTDIEAAADMIVTARDRKHELQAAITEIEDQLRSLREQLAQVERDRATAINMLRHA